MSSVSGDRQEVMAALGHALRTASAQGAIFAEAVAESVRINRTDMECMDILAMHGPTTAGQLAELTGLSTGAITGLVDRLEKAGYVRRERDSDDRRRVIIHLNAEKVEREIVPLYAPMAIAMEELQTSYSDEQLALVLDFVNRSSQVMQRETARLHERIAARSGTTPE